ncbi:MgtC family protein [Planctomycetes bacterium Pan216]|uniref:MgtC family protein n=1 Tax=Kolteria novifilia TaxID=2527975 RepID=A0A518B3I9_9BACT|nr:MgtC family protein [Planctomycetes bacterium Pan216]
MDPSVAQKLGLSLGLGLLVGLQREWTAPHVAGIRTFGILTIYGTFVALIAEDTGGWIIGAGLLTVATMLTVGSILKAKTASGEPGLTTQAAALTMYLVGVAIGLGWMLMAVVVAGAMAVLLQWKRPLHAFIERLGERDVRAIVQLVLIALVLLPVVPDRSFGPYAVINPFQIWFMVVLIVGISLGGYIAYKFLGARTGTLLGGVLGGLISSTATTVSYARRTRGTPETASMATVVIMIASTIVFGRVVFEIYIVAPHILTRILPPLFAMAGLMATVSAFLYFRVEGESEHLPIEEDPSELKAAVVFGLLYAAVLFAVAAVREHFGNTGLYIVAGLSGLTDMDAITLSTAQLIGEEQLDIDVGWRMILVGALSNLFFKAGAVALLGHRQLLWRVGSAFGVAFLGGILILLFWPAID